MARDECRNPETGAARAAALDEGCGGVGGRVCWSGSVGIAGGFGKERTGGGGNGAPSAVGVVGRAGHERGVGHVDSGGGGGDKGVQAGRSGLYGEAAYGALGLQYDPGAERKRVSCRFVGQYGSVVEFGVGVAFPGEFCGGRAAGVFEGGGVFRGGEGHGSALFCGGGRDAFGSVGHVVQCERLPGQRQFAGHVGFLWRRTRCVWKCWARRSM